MWQWEWLAQDMNYSIRLSLVCFSSDVTSQTICKKMSDSRLVMMRSLVSRKMFVCDTLPCIKFLGWLELVVGPSLGQLQFNERPVCVKSNIVFHSAAKKKTSTHSICEFLWQLKFSSMFLNIIENVTQVLVNRKVTVNVEYLYHQ